MTPVLIAKRQFLALPLLLALSAGCSEDPPPEPEDYVGYWLAQPHVWEGVDSFGAPYYFDPQGSLARELFLEPGVNGFAWGHPDACYWRGYFTDEGGIGFNISSCVIQYDDGTLMEFTDLGTTGVLNADGTLTMHDTSRWDFLNDGVSVEVESVVTFDPTDSLYAERTW